MQQIEGNLRMRWEWMEHSWRLHIQERAKRRRTCGHTGHRKACTHCGLARAISRREWEEDHPRKVRKLLSSRTHTQRKIVDY